MDKEACSLVPGGVALGIVSPSGLRPWLNGAAAKARRRSRNAQLFNFVGYGFYDIVHFSQLIKNLISVIIFYHRYMKVNT